MKRVTFNETKTSPKKEERKSEIKRMEKMIEILKTAKE